MLLFPRWLIVFRTPGAHFLPFTFSFPFDFPFQTIFWTFLSTFFNAKKEVATKKRNPIHDWNFFWVQSFFCLCTVDQRRWKYDISGKIKRKVTQSQKSRHLKTQGWKSKISAVSWQSTSTYFLTTLSRAWQPCYLELVDYLKVNLLLTRRCSPEKNHKNTPESLSTHWFCFGSTRA